MVCKNEEGDSKVFHIECFKAREEQNHEVHELIIVHRAVIEDQKYLNELCAACKYFIIERHED